MKKIEIKEVLKDILTFKNFSFFEKIKQTVKLLSEDKRFKCEVLGKRRNGEQIDLIRFGKGKKRF